MGFYPEQQVSITDPNLKGTSIEFLHKHGCQVCPLNRQPGLKHPQMPANGAKRPLVYMLGEAPGKTEDARGKPFVGKAGRTLRFRIPDEWLDRIRMNNVVRTRPPNNREPTQIEMECCRPSIIKDIEETKPKAIFGFGNIPLQWALNQQGITKWNGRYIPIKVGEHVCWFFPMLHPSFVMRSRKFEPSTPDAYGSEVEFAFANDLRNAFAMVEEGMHEPKAHTLKDLQSNIEIATDHKRVIELIESMYDEKIIGLDYETNGFRPYKTNSKILTAGMSGRESTFAFPLYHRANTWSDSQLKQVDQCFERFLYEAPCKKVVHSLAFELEWSAYFYGKKVLRAGKWEDTLSQAYILDERMGGNPGCHSLEFLCIQYLGVGIKDVYDSLDKDNLDNEPLETVLKYNGLDAKAHRLIYFPQRKRLENEGLMEVYHHQLRRIPTMVLTQLKGIPIDQPTVNEFDKKYRGQLEQIEDKIFDLDVVRKFKRMKRADFRPSANADVKFIITKILGQHVDNVDEEALSTIDHPFVTLMLEWRDVNKAHSTYVKPLKIGSKKCDIWPDGLAHPAISTHDTRTWRTSAHDFNEQNFPKRGEKREVRKQVKAGIGEIVAAFDYSGIQARNVAMESKDKKLVDAFWNNYDIHTDWCHRIAKIYPKWLKGESLKDPKIFDDHRQMAKNGFVFPSFFGAQAKKVAGELGVPEHIGQDAQNEFWSEFKDVYKWHKRLKINYYKTGYVTGLSGFRRRAPISPNQLINSPIQADESIIVCTAMANLSEYELDRYQANMEIHDDLTFIWPKKDFEKNAEIVIREMTKVNYPWINVPLGVEVSIGENWCDLEKISKHTSVEIWGHKRAT